MLIRWSLAISAGVILGILALYPQYNLQRNLRGAEFSGAFASCDLDEMAYASYLQALIDGRPRKNDPYTGRDDENGSGQYESLFSIQFFPAYLAAIPARILGLSGAQLMPILSFVSAFFTALAIFWLIVSITEDEFIAFTGTLVILVGSALVVGLGAINSFYEGGAAYPFFPYLRRYIPGLAFPFLFAFFACLWNGLINENKKKRIVYSILSSLCFAAIVFSYFYVWTSAAAVMSGLMLFVLVFRTENWRKDFVFLAITGAFCVLSIGFYGLLLSNRNPVMDKAQLLVLTHKPDFLQKVEILGYFVLTFTALALVLKLTKLAERKAYFSAAFAFAPLLVFNQQVLTGKSLQPFHYEFYVINYVVLLAIVLVAAVFWKKLFGKIKVLSIILLLFFSVVSVIWGYVEARETTVFWDDVNVRRDEAMPVNLRLKELAQGSIETAKRQTTLNLEPLQADGQPTVAPQAVVWARHQHVFSGLKDWEENKRRYYQLLYYSDLDAEYLRKSLTGCRNIEACMALFGWDRFNAKLSANARPLTLPEVEEEVKNYEKFSSNFNLADAVNPEISYVVVYAEAGDELKNLDLWYQRDSGEYLGKYVIYKTTFKTDLPK
ncbi:MAG: hypothetical protein ABIP06_07680 [Pyrinomonadaceae bacterium]